LYGVLPGFLALVLFVFDPNIIAHSRLITTDIYATGMVALTIYTFWLFSKHRNWKFAILSATALGVSQLAKYTSAYLYPILAVIVLVRDFRLWGKILRERDIQKAWRHIKTGMVNVLFFLLVSVLIINIGFLFNKTFTPIKDYAFRSELFQSIQAKLTPIGFLPVPTPYPYLDGLDWVQSRERSGEGYGRLYLLGELRQGEGFKGYYIIASLLKTPIASQIIVLLAIGVYLINRKDYQFFENEVFLFVPIVFFFYYFNFIFRAQIGIRFYLVIFPFLYVFSGGLVKNWHNFKSRSKFGLVCLLIYLIGSVIGAYPHYIPYFNELIGDQKNAYKYLVDSNLDWDQALGIRDQYLLDNPEAIFEPSRPTFGRIIVSPNNLVGILLHKDRYAWLLENFEPVDTIADVYLIYEITEEDYQGIQNKLEE
jgi:4-amino-4-deoxy-L-arabinose transferase-like glycosyltransferase